MTKKDYIAIAAALKNGVSYNIYKTAPVTRSMHALLCNEIAHTLAQDNPRFDRQTFFIACGMNKEARENV